MKKYFIILAVALVALTSCQTKQAAINDLRSLTQEMQLNSNYYTLSDWEKAGVKYYNINKRIKAHAGDYTNEEMKEIGDLNGQCARSFTDGAVNKVKGAKDMLKSFVEGFLK